jgi:nicotinamidase/pyrazinamidase
VRTVFFDVDTQLDFLYPAGALYVPGAEALFEKLNRLTRYAAANGIKIISTADAHTEDDPEFKTWKPHCVAGTFGQQRAAATSLPSPLILPSQPGALEAVRGKLDTAKQIIVEKQNIDCFTNGNLRPLLDVLNAERYVVYGVVTEVCVQCAAFGLLKTGAQVSLVTDAIKAIDVEKERVMLARFEGAGGSLTSVEMITVGGT